ncbi:MAG TPA: ribbon-helix-helix domain-containing protein [Candidatus Limnocylindrales bacterium]|nr:ribbon-helix-helix domain-containing protein [Candidatus Limnocylindrales bacterium]
MQKVMEKETIVPVRFAKHELQKIDEAAKRMGAKSRSAFLRQAAERYVEEVGSLKIIEIREDVSFKEAAAEILAYLKEHKEAETFDIANDLRLDLDFTVKVLKKLWEEGKVS